MTDPDRPHVEAGNMIRDEADEWIRPDPVGRFDIHVSGIGGYPAATAHIIFVCPNSRRCSVLLGPNFIPRPEEGKCNIWGWNGDCEKPTITPSINCIAEKDGKPTGGCGWHGFITNGVIR